VPEAWRADLWRLIADTPALTWTLLTKRPQNIRKMLPGDWGDGYPNVWLGVTTENQEEAERRIPLLRAVPAVVRFLSAEPLLEMIKPDLRGIAWVISGGESGSKNRRAVCGVAAGAARSVRRRGRRLLRQAVGRQAGAAA
jgi:protein gp37